MRVAAKTYESPRKPALLGLLSWFRSHFSIPQPQPNRQRFAEELTLFISGQFDDFLDAADQVSRRPAIAQHLEDALAVRVVEVQGALAAAACDLGQAEEP